MNKKFMCTAATACFFLLLSSTVVASDLDMSDLDIFLERCGSCHKKGGGAEPVNPADKAGVVWAKYFKRDRHPGDLNGTINAYEMNQIIVFLQNHAADSDHPVAAIIPK